MPVERSTALTKNGPMLNSSTAPVIILFLPESTCAKREVRVWALQVLRTSLYTQFSMPHQDREDPSSSAPVMQERRIAQPNVYLVQMAGTFLRNILSPREIHDSNADKYYYQVVERSQRQRASAESALWIPKAAVWTRSWSENSAGRPGRGDPCDPSVTKCDGSSHNIANPDGS